MKPLRTTLLLFVVPSLLAALVPASLIYDRAEILAGAWWRLATGQWVHFSASHAAWNLLVLLAAGTWLEHVRPGALLRYTLSAAPLLGVGLLIVAPTMSRYGGLSGLAVGVIVLLALIQLDHPARRDRGWWFAVLALVAGKILWEAQVGRALFSELAADTFVPSVAAHVLGAATALLYHAAARTASLLFPRIHLS